MPGVLLLAALLADPTPVARPAVVINELFYHAPDDLDRVQWVELHGLAAGPVDVSGWTLDGGRTLTVPADTTLPAGGFLVFALDLDAFAVAYPDAVAAAGTLARPLRRGGQRLELRDATGRLVDVARYANRSPWPTTADGQSASLERICPTAAGDSADNWAGSPLPDAPRPAGTPGRPNAALSAALPPVVTTEESPAARPNQPLTVAATVAGAPARGVTLLYRAVTPKAVGDEVAVPMTAGAGGRWTADVPGQKAGTLLRYRVRATGTTGAVRHHPAEHDLRPTRSVYVHEPFGPAPLARGFLVLGPVDRKPPPQVGGRDRGAREAPHPPRGGSAFVHVGPAGGPAEVFDYMSAAPRAHRPDSGHVLHFHKDRPFNGQTAVSLFHEGSDRWLLDEALSYDLYRRMGNAAPLTEFVRMTVDGKPVGHRLMVERPNKAFLRRNGVDPGGHLYKVIWQGDGLKGTHVKKTRPHDGYADLEEVVAVFDKTRKRPAEQWAAIRERCDVEQMATFFAVNMALAHWDGYFNNHFAYHDTRRGKWQLYPWDHDQAWGEGGGGDELPLTELPLTFGREGAEPPPGRPAGWWRPGGVFSRPMLANRHFRPVFLAAVRRVLDEAFTEAVYGPELDKLVGKLVEDAHQSGRPAGEVAAMRGWLTNDAAGMKAFLAKRRAFLLAQPELKK